MTETTNFSILKFSRTTCRDVVSMSLTPFNNTLNNITIMKELCPTNLLARRLLRHTITDEKFTQLYREKILSKLDPQTIYDEVKDKVVCDWFGMGEVSPRSVFVDWIKEELGIVIPELPYVKKSKPQ